ncbi:mRNA capping enzyme, guanylyltransferase (alpha) subunit, partial [Pseudoloma neurophilia]
MTTYDLDKIGVPIPENEKARFLQSMNEKINNPKGVFPGFHAVTLLKRHLLDLIEFDYFACEKSDGTRSLLYIKNYENNSYHFLIDRKMEVFQIFNVKKFNLKSEYLFDGEFLITKDKNPIFTIFDTIMYDNYMVINLSLLERLDLAYKSTKILSQLYNFKITTKKMYKSYGFAEAYNERESLAHECDGLVFTKVYEPYMYGTCPTLYKWKPPYLNTVDFLMKYIGNGTYELFCLGKRIEY